MQVICASGWMKQSFQRDYTPEACASAAGKGKGVLCAQHNALLLRRGVPRLLDSGVAVANTAQIAAHS